MMSSFSVAGNRTLFSLQRENSDTCCNVEEPRGPMLVSCQSLKVSYCRILLMPGSQDSQVHGDREVGKWAERFIWASRVPAEKGAELEGPTWDLGAPLIAQLVKNPPAMWETWVRSQGWEDPLEKGTTTHSSILAWRIWHMQRVWHDWVTFTHSLRLRPWVCKQIMGWGILVRTCPSTCVCVCGVCVVCVVSVCLVCGVCMCGVCDVCGVWKRQQQ